MIHALSHREGRRGLTAVCFGVAAAGLIVMMDQVSDDALAHADDYSTLVADIQGVQALGQLDLSAAATDFSGGVVVQGLAETFTGLNDTTVAPGEWLLLGGFDAINGAMLPPSDWFNFDGALLIPTSWSDAVANVTTLSSIGSDFMSAASDAFAGGDPSAGLAELLVAGDYYGLVAPEELVLGLATVF